MFPRYGCSLPCVADFEHLRGLVLKDWQVLKSRISLAEQLEHPKNPQIKSLDYVGGVRRDEQRVNLGSP
jgi:hypothetical protein